MKITCVRCNTEFQSGRKQTHVCPTCQFVFSEDDADRGNLVIVSPTELIHQKKEAHRLHEKTVAKCAYHDDVEAIAECVSCGRPVCYVCAVETGHGCHCELCADASGPAPTAPRRPSSKSGIHPGTGFAYGEEQPHPVVDWENRRRIGRRKALFATWRQTLFHPARFFREACPGGGYFSPLLYGMIWVLTGFGAGILWKIILRVYPQIVSLLGGETIHISLRLAPEHIAAGVAFVSLPLIAAFALMAVSVLFHMSVAAFTRGHSGFKTTLRVVCYSAGAYAFFLIPTLGGLIAGIWQMILMTEGFRRAHRIPFPLAVLIAFPPCALLFAAGMVFTSWAVVGSRLDLASFLGRLLFQ